MNEVRDEIASCAVEDYMMGRPLHDRYFDNRALAIVVKCTIISLDQTSDDKSAVEILNSY